MGVITQEKNLEMLQKLPDGNYKKYNPITKVENVIGAAKQADLESHLNDKAASGVHGLSPERVRKITAGTANPNASQMEEGEVYLQYE